jgi:integrase
MRFHEKGSKSIWKPMPGELAELLRVAVEIGVIESTPTAYVVPMRRPQRRKGERDDRIIYRLIKQIGARAGVAVHVHALRAAFAVKYSRRTPDASSNSAT